MRPPVFDLSPGVRIHRGDGQPSDELIETPGRRLLRLSAGAALFVHAPEGVSPVAAPQMKLVRSLWNAGALTPRLDGLIADDDLPLITVSVVIPTHNDRKALASALDALAASAARSDRDGGVAIGEVIVVDDGSEPALRDEDLVVDAAFAVRLVRQENRGPGAARNAGVREAVSPIIVFVDTGVEPSETFLDPLVELLLRFDVAVAAPRVLPAAGGVWAIDAYESRHSPLDMGRWGGLVGSGRAVSYVPSTALVLRRDVFEQLGGFDESMRYGEDVDLVWRAAEAGHIVAYEPRSVVRHPARSSLHGLLRQRFDYGTSAAALDRRHPGRVAPLTVPVYPALAASATTAGHPLVGLASLLGSVWATAGSTGLRLEMTPVKRLRLAGRLVVGGQLSGLNWFMRGLWRTLGPAPLALLASSKTRRLGVAYALAPFADWRPTAGGPLRWWAMRSAESSAYAAGVWAGSWRRRSLGALRPSVQLPLPRPLRSLVGRWVRRSAPRSTRNG